jgi:4-oxalocrotonate tautomerase
MLHSIRYYTFLIDDLKISHESYGRSVAPTTFVLSSFICSNKPYFRLLLYSSMPIITVAMYSGRTQRDKDRLAEAITEDVVNILKVEKKDVVIVFQEASHGNWFASGVRL